MIFPKLANFIDFRFLHVYAQSTWNFVFKIWKIVVKLKTDVDTFGFKIEKSSISQNILKINEKKNLDRFFSNWTLFLFSEPNVVYIYPFLSSLPFPKFYVFWSQKCNLVKFSEKNSVFTNTSHSKPIRKTLCI